MIHAIASSDSEDSVFYCTKKNINIELLGIVFEITKTHM